MHSPPSPEGIPTTILRTFVALGLGALLRGFATPGRGTFAAEARASGRSRLIQGDAPDVEAAAGLARHAIAWRALARDVDLDEEDILLLVGLDGDFDDFDFDRSWSGDGFGPDRDDSQNDGDNLD